MPGAHLAIVKTKLLLGEGKEEVRFFGALLQHLNISEIQVEEYGGKPKLASFLRMAVGSPDFASLISVGVTRDADDDANAAFQSVCSALQSARLAVPNAPNTAAIGGPSVSVFILPDNTNSGMLEDLCLSSVQTHAAYSCLDGYFQCAANAGRVPNNMSKARIHAWLASEIEPDRQLGVAAEAGSWPWMDPAFDLIRDFVKSL